MTKLYNFLLVEDEPADAELVMREIRKEFHSVNFQVASSKDEYLRLLGNMNPDVILSDYKLPSFNGHEALQIAKSKCPEIPFIFVSGFLGEERAVATLREGATDYVIKENLTKLCPAIGRALKELESKRENSRVAQLLKESEEKYRTLINDVLDTSKVGVLILDKDYKIVWVNKMIEQIFLLKREELLGKDERDIIKKNFKDFLTQPNDFIDVVISAFSNNDFIETFEFKISHGKDSPEMWLKYWSQPIQTGLYKGGRIEHYYDITRRRKAEDEIKTALKEKEVLLREIHHRVKNNMQVISSLLKLQSSNIDNEYVKNAFIESHNRIRSMSLVHERLYRSTDLSNIEFGVYVKILANELVRIFNMNTDRIKLNYDLEEVEISIDKAIPCGLIINEVLSNSMKYAFPNNSKGEITIKLKKLDKGKVELCLMDNGVGLSKDIDIANTDSLGIKLIYLLGHDQLHSEIEVDKTMGTKYSFKFNLGN